MATSEAVMAFQRNESSIAVSAAGYEVHEEIHTGRVTAVFRARRRADGQRVILKVLSDRYPLPHAVARLRNEHELLHGLQLPGVVRAYALDASGHRCFLVLEDFGGRDLARHLAGGRLSLEQALSVAIAIAAALADVHEQMVIHKDVKPSNIVWNRETGAVKLIDFGLATRLSRESPRLEHPKQLQGTLAYIAPEQTGRMNRAVDRRSDLYSAGVTLYELFAGGLPFDASDPMALIHAHLARAAPPLQAVAPHVPLAVSDIVMRLLAKNAEDRYQTAAGLKADLEEVEQALRRTGRVEPFALGRHDAYDRLEIPQKLYGREQQVRQILEAFDRAAAGPGEIVLVSGYSGIGKSSLVRELYAPITARRGAFITGKYELMQSNTPYSAIGRAFESLIEQLLTEGPETVAHWREKLLSELAEGASVLADVLPKLVLITGPLPPAPHVGPSEAENRFHLLFQRFIRLFATPEHPLTLFLDDLQWADTASQRLLCTLFPNTAHLLLVGAYRDNEVGEGHPWKLTEDELRKTAVPITDIRLEPLDLPTVARMLSDTLRSSPQQTSLLAELVLHKTGGNPFFLIELLRALHSEGLLEYRRESRSWTWNLSRIQARDLTDSVVALMVDRLKRLDPRARQALKLAAAVGNPFDLGTVALLRDSPAHVVAREIWHSMAEGLVTPVGDAHLLFEHGLGDHAQVDPAGLAAAARYRFAHDRIQQAAYSLIAAEQRPALHLQIGQLLEASLAGDWRGEELFVVVNHKNAGRALLFDKASRERLAELNLVAGNRAKSAAAHGQALQYLMTGFELVGQDGFESCHELAMEIAVNAAEAAFLARDAETMQRMTAAVLAHGRTPLSRVRAHDILVQHCIAQNDPVGGIGAAREALAMLGVTLPADPSFEDVGRAVEALRAALGDRSIPTLVDLPQMTDLHALSVERFLRRLANIAYTGAPPLFALAICDIVRRAVVEEKGVTANTTIGFAAFGLLVCQVSGDMALGYQLGELALALVDRLNAKAVSSQVRFFFHCFVRHWQDYARTFAEQWLDGYREGLASGDFFSAALSMFNYSTFHPFWMGKELPAIRAEMDRCNSAILAIHQILSLDLNQMYCQAIAGLLGESQDPLVLQGAFYDEAQTVPFYLAIGHANALAQLYLIKLMIAYLLGDVDLAIELANKAEPHLGGIQGTMAVPAFYFYDSLARLSALGRGEGVLAEVVILDKVSANQAKLAEWGRQSPRNYGHKHLIVEAERLRRTGRGREAQDAFEAAIDAANQNQYLPEEAIALELAGLCHLENGRSRAGGHYLRDARDAYAAWGAEHKVQRLEATHRGILLRSSRRPGQAAATTTTSSAATGSPVDTVDLLMVLQASQAVSGEIVLERLLSTLMKVVVQNAGGERGLLVLDRGGVLQIEAQGGADVGSAVLPVAVRGSGLVPETVIAHVARSRQAAVLEDARHDARFGTDPYIVREQPKSILCAPVLHQGELSCIVYLENRIALGAFTESRLELYRILLAQAAISIQNARLYASLEESNRTLERRVLSRTRELDERNAELSAKNAEILRAQNQLVLQEKMASLGTLTAGIAHEIKNPLNFVNNFAGFQIPMIDELREVLAPHVAGDVQTLLSDLTDSARAIERNGARANAIVDRMMELAKKDTGERQSIEVNRYASEYALLSLQGQKSRHELEVALDLALDPDCGVVVANPQHLSTVMVHLVNNAVESVREKLSARGAAFRPQIRVWTQGWVDRVDIGVWDNGLGIASDHGDKIFTPFFTTRPPGSGHIGLGLSLCYDIVRGHGGQIRMTTREGEFAELTVSLPRGG